MFCEECIFFYINKHNDVIKVMKYHSIFLHIRIVHPGYHSIHLIIKLKFIYFFIFCRYFFINCVSCLFYMILYISDEKGLSVGASCEFTCSPKLMHVYCNPISGLCECEKKYPVKLNNPYAGCSKRKCIV